MSVSRRVLTCALAPLLLVPVSGGGGAAAPGAAPAGGGPPGAVAAGGPLGRATAGASAAPSATAPDGRTGRWSWPLAPVPTVVRRFEPPAGPWGPGHRGVDLSAAAGAAVTAVAAGVVAHAGTVAGRGTVTVRHAGGLSSTYEPVIAHVARGDPVTAGTVLGRLDGTVGDLGHCGPAPCLHLGARRGDVYLDPLLLVVGGRVRLLPLTGWPRW
jgi:murein DD-endopeptidase MepM/ murein hydrolase activator NlpD